MQLQSSRNIWILGRGWDLLFFVFTPLLIIPVFLSLPKGLDTQTLALYILGLGGFGHHLPGFIRAYADRDLFARHKLSFTLVPVLLIAVCCFYSFLSLNALACITVAWGLWHGAMQVNGFMRIYDAKVRSFAPATARLDWLMCIAWFGMGLLHSPDKQFSLAVLFYGSGGFLIPPWAFELLRRTWDVGTAAVTLMFLANAFRQWKAGAPPSAAKLLIMASSFGFWWYSSVSLGNLLLGVLMWEIFHDIQYNVLVWYFQRHRVDGAAAGSKSGSGRIGWAEKLLFSPGPGRLALYAGLILAYGYLGILSSFASVQLPMDVAAESGITPWLVRIALASALLHFYYDGFIWKLRESNVRRDLGVQEVVPAAARIGMSAPLSAKTKVQSATSSSASPPPPVSPTVRAGSRVAWLWLLFIVPMAYMGLAQHRGWNPDFATQVRNLADAIPGNWKADFMTGTYFKGQGETELAELHYRKAVSARPDFAMGHMFLGDILYKEGKMSEAAEEYRQYVALEPDNLDGKKNLARLYLRTGQLTLAVEEFRSLLGAEPDDADLNYGLASALLQQNKLTEAAAFAEKALRLSPDHSGALNCLGMIRDLQGNMGAAVDYYRQSLASDSGNVSAKENLAAILAKPAPATKAEAEGGTRKP
jgi:tetratricopeptide (TPR) repeat protein